MYREVVNLLKCPTCGGKLELFDTSTSTEEILMGTLKCNNNHSWEITDGIADFSYHGQGFKTDWPNFQQEVNFNELESTILEKTPKNLLNIYKKAARDVIHHINSAKPKYIIDISTGLGLLITKVLEKTNFDTHIICTDLNYDILKYNMSKAQTTKKNIKISYVSCDPTNLPFEDNAFDLATSFFGISNLVNFMPNGIDEAKRVLNNDKFLINTCTIVKTNSKGYLILKELIDANNLNPSEKFITLGGIKNVHASKNFKDVKIKMIDESIGEKNELELLPFENEWFAILNIYCRK